MPRYSGPRWQDPSRPGTSLPSRGPSISRPSAAVSADEPVITKIIAIIESDELTTQDSKTCVQHLPTWVQHLRANMKTVKIVIHCTITTNNFSKTSNLFGVEDCVKIVNSAITTDHLLVYLQQHPLKNINGIRNRRPTIHPPFLRRVPLQSSPSSALRQRSPGEARCPRQCPGTA